MPTPKKINLPLAFCLVFLNLSSLSPLAKGQAKTQKKDELKAAAAHTEELTLLASELSGRVSPKKIALNVRKMAFLVKEHELKSSPLENAQAPKTRAAFFPLYLLSIMPGGESGLTDPRNDCRGGFYTISVRRFLSPSLKGGEMIRGLPLYENMFCKDTLLRKKSNTFELKVEPPSPSSVFKEPKVSVSLFP